MPRPRQHDTDVMLDAARSIALERGARAVTVEAIAAQSGAPMGSLYHRFGSRDKILTAAWDRALQRFQGPLLEELRRNNLREAALGAARWIIGFARSQPHDARLLAAFRPADVLTDPDTPEALRLASGNIAIRDAISTLAGQSGAPDPARVRELISLAVIDIAGGAIRRRLLDGASVSTAFEADVLAAVAAVIDRIPAR
ncbi:TetR/AcrR family transcriptional regulator [Mycobacterium simiae]|uniref:TetR/AcrR family transcriptional regulator n=1 Tax=Mycobacterium simiae TaxID=1784 RepID=A0A5B1BT61_MYCSI|nr:TetR/AcrR family transcriptional regulator [Mycobacterium simiae]KAA1250640.1 TetR/AcrR family transcriptional regulator [Mycobacterium simiae]